jgi:site-specific DNA-methyltransferase (adenine-specific)
MTANPILIGVIPNRARSPHGERRSPSPQARDHARTAVPSGRIFQGDCIQRMRAMPSQSVDFVLTDPPYITRYRDRSGRMVVNDNNADWLAPAFAEMFRLLKPAAFCVTFYGWPHVDLFMSAWRAAGFRPVSHIVFRKPYSSRTGFMRGQHECAFLLAKGDPQRPTSPIADVLDWRDTGNLLHPTQKPIEALKPLIAAFSPRGGVVLDPFCGSGSTLVAALELGRDYVGIELDAAHCATATRRLDATERSAS